ncbi:hypothetical protein DID96_25485 [Burkholderia sp. Bp8963]|uniref:DUF5908 family protein n=1 Tax=Burkholderia sp. Bp8963 TaxID=2184547 RepID=UPI000F5922BE|nr:DUF5908 family protein [Burkholderia sp. Bp8963]RQS65781.1 hypothetical protein DID96_25485 [Burkholderia sp. Bp8963]
MPVEIKELHIRVTVLGKPPETAGGASNTVAAKGAGHDEHGAGKDEVVAECVEQVLQILQAMKER